MPKTSPFCPTSTLRRALTLIEMLVGMAITLVMMAAVVNLFANISTGVNNRQGAMEISSELRIARQRLYNDLAGATVKTDAVDSSDGYFEIVEGQASDESPRLGTIVASSLDPAISLIPSSNAVTDAEGNLADPSVVTDFGGLGDYDDILALTVESKGALFRGRGRTLVPGGNQLNPNDWVGTTIESRFAEVIWFAVENPADGSRGEPGMRTIYRRVLLIAPWVATYDIPGGATGQPDPIFDLSGGNPTSLNFHPTATTFAGRLQALRRFQNDYDISVRFENQRMVPNTLADLSRREHRFAHMTNPSGYPQNAAGFYPYPFPYNTVDLQGVPAITYYEPPGRIDAGGNPVSSLQPFGGDRTGGDIVLTNALAFDVQVFDPGAPLFLYPNAQGSIIHPGSTVAFTQTVRGATPGVLIGFGEYVDLGWDDGGRGGTNNDPDYDFTLIANAPVPHFQRERLVGWHPRLPLDPKYRGNPSTYDTWTDYYESDQVDQDNRDNDNNHLTGVDEGTNGLDDDGVNGPDDPMERETSPPYPTPLKGVQVKLRIYEPNSRAIREANVTRKMTE